MKKSTLIPIILVLAGAGLFWYLTRNTDPAGISPDTNLSDTLQFSSPVSLVGRPFTGDFALPEGLLGAKPAFAAYSFRDATKTLYQYDIFLFHRGEARGPKFESLAEKAAFSNPATESSSGAGWLTDKTGRKICLMPLPEQPFRYAPGKKVVTTVLFFEHRTLPVDVVALQTVVKEEQPRPKVSLPGAPPIERLPEPELPLADAAGALEAIVTSNP